MPWKTLPGNQQSHSNIRESGSIFQFLQYRRSIKYDEDISHILPPGSFLPNYDRSAEPCGDREPGVRLVLALEY